MWRVRVQIWVIRWFDEVRDWFCVCDRFNEVRDRFCVVRNPKSLCSELNITSLRYCMEHCGTYIPCNCYLLAGSTRHGFLARCIVAFAKTSDFDFSATFILQERVAWTLGLQHIPGTHLEWASRAAVLILLRYTCVGEPVSTENGESCYDLIDQNDPQMSRARSCLRCHISLFRLRFWIRAQDAGSWRDREYSQIVNILVFRNDIELLRKLSRPFACINFN